MGKLGKYKRLSARANMPLLEYAAHLERKRAVHDKRKQVRGVRLCRLCS